MVSGFSAFVDRHRARYRTWRPMYCQAIDLQVTFTMRGFNHLRFKANNTPRLPEEVVRRLRLLSTVRLVLENATQATSYRLRKVYLRRGNLKEVEYWAFDADNKGKRFRVIVRKFSGSRQAHFWSVMRITQKSPPLG